MATHSLHKTQGKDVLTTCTDYVNYSSHCSTAVEWGPGRLVSTGEAAQPAVTSMAPGAANAQLPLSHLARGGFRGEGPSYKTMSMCLYIASLISGVPYMQLKLLIFILNIAIC